jgi:hypothetical protein
MSFTRTQWAQDLLHALGNGQPSVLVTNFIVGWTCFETLTDQGAKYNLLNTTQPLPGSTFFNDLGNGIGVQNYLSYQDGLKANKITLVNGYYPDIVAMLLGNTYYFTDAMQQQLTKWSGGTPYGSNFVSVGSGRGGDTFTYGGTPTPVPPPVFTPSANQRKAGVDQWIAPWLRWNLPSPPTGSGIFNLWLGYLIRGHNLGPPLTWEYDTIDWQGNPIIAQEFARARCEWSNGAGKFYDENGIINP